MITTEKTAELVKTFGTKFGKGEKDSGSSAVQVAILTTRINNLKAHFANNSHDYHSNRGLMKMIGKRRSLLRYVKTKNAAHYTDLIKDLGLRK